MGHVENLEGSEVAQDILADVIEDGIALVSVLSSPRTNSCLGDLLCYRRDGSCDGIDCPSILEGSENLSLERVKYVGIVGNPSMHRFLLVLFECNSKVLVRLVVH